MEKRQYEKLGETIYHAVLPNGLHVYVDQRPEFTKKYAFLASNYGGKDVAFHHKGKDYRMPDGVAHFLEHKMFDMPEGNALQTLSKYGASPNAYTSSDITAYHFECIDHFEENLETLVRFVTTTYFTQPSVDKEQGIIGQEIRMNDDDIFWNAYYNMLNCMYAHHPIKTSILGTVESIGQITAETLITCHKAFYHPTNLVLCVAGNVDPQQVCEIAQASIDVEESVPPEHCFGEQEPHEVLEQYVEARMELATSFYLIGFKMEAGNTGDALLRQILLAGLACEAVLGKSSPLYSRLYQEGVVNSSYSYEHEVLPDYAMILLSGEGGDPKKLREEILAEAKRIAAEGIEPTRWERMLKSEYGSYVRGLNGLDSVCRMMSAAHMYQYDFFRFPELFSTLKKEEVEQMAAEIFTAETSTLSVIAPHQA